MGKIEQLKPSASHGGDGEESWVEESSYYPMSAATRLVSNKASIHRISSLDQSTSTDTSRPCDDQGSCKSSWTSSDDGNIKELQDDRSSSSSVPTKLSMSLHMTDRKLMQARTSPGALRLTTEGLKRHESKTFDESMETPVKAIGDGYCSWKRRHDHRRYHRKMNTQPNFVPGEPTCRGDGNEAMRRPSTTTSRGASQSLKEASSTHRRPEPKILEQEEQGEKGYHYKRQTDADCNDCGRIERLRQQELARQRRLHGLDRPSTPPIPTARNESGPSIGNLLKDQQDHPNKNERVRFRSRSSQHQRRSMLPKSPPLVINSEDEIEVLLDCKLSSVIDGLTKKEKESPYRIQSCVVCTTKERTHVALPCRHFSFCRDCVRRLNQSQNSTCPVCCTPNVKYARVPNLIVLGNGSQ